MDQLRLSRLYSAAISEHVALDPLAVAACLTPREFAAAAEARGLQVMALATPAGATALQHAEAPPIPGIDETTAAKLEALSPDFREVVTARYTEKRTTVDGYIQAEKLPEDYRLPPLAELIDRVTALALAYKVLSAVPGTKIDFDFIPQRLTSQQKHDLATGHVLPNGGISVGIDDHNTGRQLVDSVNPSDDESLWDVAIMDVSPVPALRGMSADGSSASPGIRRETILHDLADIRYNGLHVPAISRRELKQRGLIASELLINQLSPSEATIFGMQLGRLERGEPLLDAHSTCTIGKESVEPGRSLITQANASDGRLILSSARSADARYTNVIRLSAQGVDSISQV